MRKEIREKFDEIVAFAEIDKFLDTPVKRYSSGMYIRLAFAVAAHLDPEILLIDEVLAVGDEGFQRKCLDKMENVANLGRTILFVSHNLAAIERLCHRCLLLNGGQVQDCGLPSDVIKNYLDLGSDQRLEWRNPQTNSTQASVRRVAICDRQDKVLAGVASNSTVNLLLECDVAQPLADLRLGVVVSDALGRPVFSTAPIDDNCKYPTASGRHLYRVEFPPQILMPQRYSISVTLYRPAIGSESRPIDQQPNILVFDVAVAASIATLGDHLRPGVVQLQCKWQHTVLTAGTNHP